ncbi:biotin transporter BioY [Levilactobacillus brevis]|uniref:biotin transporter BioY n=1 Tax=Levilactobacillus brevis TaxID=1580 RepID=UPI001D6F406A|nr:biotin transporter BioY [Levilactobacillus brevis]
MQERQSIPLVGLFIAIIVIFGFFPAIPLAISPVPLVLQNMGVMVVTLLLPTRQSLAAIGLFLLLVLVGLPVLASRQAGPAVFLGPNGGYLVGWLIMPLMLQGLTYGRVLRLVAILLSAMGVDILGAVWLSTVTTMSLPQALVATLAFIPGDLLKAVGAWWLAQRLRKWAPKMI